MSGPGWPALAWDLCPPRLGESGGFRRRGSAGRGAARRGPAVGMLNGAWLAARAGGVHARSGPVGPVLGSFWARSLEEEPSGRMQIVRESIALSSLQEMAEAMFGNLVKAVVDVELGIMAVDGELHADEEALLLEHGSEQRHLWGINIYPDLPNADRIEFDSMINIRPSQGNRSRRVDDPAIRGRIVHIVDYLISA